MVPKEEVRLVLEGREPTASQWEENDWTLIGDVGKRLHAEYAMIVARRIFPNAHFKFVLINVETAKRFENISFIPEGSTMEDWRNTYKASLNKLYHDAREDFLATAIRKGRMASKEIAQTQNEMQNLKETSPQARPSPLEAGKQEKVAQLEARLATLMETLSQLEGMKNQFEEEKKKAGLLAKELEERDQREKALMTQLKDSSKNPPVIVVASPQDDSKVEINFIHLSGVAEDEKGIKRLEIFINNKPLLKGSDRGITMTEVKSPKRLEFKERIALEKGANRIKIRAIDSDDLFSEKVLTVQYVEKRKSIWAVVIGINEYPKIRPLKYAVNDARIFYDYLVGHNRIPPENVALLLNQDASLTKIRSTLGTQLKNNAGKDDMVIIFFAGHGATEKDAMSPDGDGLEKYLLPVDADLKDLYATALPMGELSRIFARIRSERLVFIADSCYSGASGGRTIDVSGLRASLSDAFLDRIAGGKGRVIITASGANEVSAEKDELQQGVFTYFLVEGLRGKADIDKDGLISVDEVYRYVSDRVPKATAQEQHPVKKGTVEGNLILGVTQ